jgi:hypothetical protein
MATDLDGIFNFGLKGLRDRKIFDKWLHELKALNLEKAKDHDGVEEIGEWKYYITGYGGDDPLDNEPSFPYEVIYEGPYMQKIILMDDISSIPTHYRLNILFNQPDWFFEYLKEVYSMIKIFGGNELIWLSSLGSASYSSIYQCEVWENTPYEKVKQLLTEQYGTPKTTYQEMADYGKKFDFEYNTINVFLVDKLEAK